MTLDVSTTELVCAAAFLGAQIITLTGVVRSNRDQGRRLGRLEQWRRAKIAVARERRRAREEARRG